VWYANLVANPQVEVRDGTVVRAMTAREVEGEEKAIWWQRCVDAFPDYANYQEKTERSIPVFVLTPTAR
jgi:deazaflavin-dependent oxidoreductase (nitroreductase family)